MDFLREQRHELFITGSRKYIQVTRKEEVKKRQEQALKAKNEKSHGLCKILPAAADIGIQSVPRMTDVGGHFAFAKDTTEGLIKQVMCI